jgi:hypothetical protein
LGSKRTSAAAKAAAAANNARGWPTLPASGNDSSDTEGDGGAEDDEAPQRKKEAVRKVPGARQHPATIADNAKR